MAVIPQRPLFGWPDIDVASDLDRFLLVLSALPDEPLVRYLECLRGRGRDDYPIRPTWNALLAGIVFQHVSAASLLRELRRNGELRQLCGFDPLLGEAAVPSDDAFGRFLALIIAHLGRLKSMFHQLVDELYLVRSNLGAKTAVDSKAIPSHGKPVTNEEKQKEPDRRRDNDADWGKKTYRGKRKDGTSWEKVTKWFGYKLHLLVDSVYELPLGFSLTPASKSDCPELIPLVQEQQVEHPKLHAGIDELSADKGYDSTENNRDLHNDHEIKPVIDKRTLWKSEPTRPLYPDRVDSFVYDEQGHIYCICPTTGEQRDLSFVGFEKDRNTLKYRCPAAACGVSCPGRAECEARSRIGVGDYGRVVRVPLDLDRRIFTPIARPTAKWGKSYDRRTAVERVNARIDRVLGFELHYIRGQEKMETRVTLALIVMLAMALGRIRAGQPAQMRSLVAPVQRAA